MERGGAYVSALQAKDQGSVETDRAFSFVVEFILSVARGAAINTMMLSRDVITDDNSDPIEWQSSGKPTRALWCNG